MKRPETFRVGAYGVLIEEGKVLVTHTRTRSGLIWNLPGGALEVGEGALDALKREFIEETGLQVEASGLAHASERFHQSKDYPENQLVKLYWFVKRTGGELSSGGNGDDIAECRFVPAAEIFELGLTSADSEMAHALRARGIW